MLFLRIKTTVLHSEPIRRREVSLETSEPLSYRKVFLRISPVTTQFDSQIYETWFSCLYFCPSIFELSFFLFHSRSLDVLFFNLFSIAAFIKKLGNRVGWFIVKKFFNLFSIAAFIQKLGNRVGWFIVKKFFNLFSIAAFIQKLGNRVGWFIAKFSLDVKQIVKIKNEPH